MNPSDDSNRFDKEVMSEQWDADEAALEWLADPVAQSEYLDYLKMLESKHAE